MKKYSWLLVLVVLVSLAACGSAVEPEEPDEDLPTTDLVQLDPLDDRADRRAQWRTRVEGLTMWIDTTLQPESDGANTRWLLRGRVSKSLAAFRAYTPQGQPLATDIPSARTFEVRFDADQITALLAGTPVLFDFFPARGARGLYSGTASFAPRFADWSGTTKLFVYRSLKPVLVGDQIRFRGRASARDGHELEMIDTDSDRDPALFTDGADKWRFDFSVRGLLHTAEQPGPSVTFRIFDGAERRLEKNAGIELRLVTLGLTLDPVFETWPRTTCRDEVATCLAELDHRDTEACGWATEVRACLGDGSALPEGPSPERFVEDLRDEIEAWYESSQRDATEFRAPPLQEALDNVSLDDVHELDDIEDSEYFDYDPNAYKIYWHPDPVFEGSDRVWYGVYFPSGELQSVYVVN